MDSKVLIFVTALVASDANPVWINGNNYLPDVDVRIGRSPNVAYGYISSFNSNFAPYSTFGSSFQTRKPHSYGDLRRIHNNGNFRVGIATTSSVPFVPYQQSSATRYNGATPSVYYEGSRRVGPNAYSITNGLNYINFPFAQTYYGDFDIADDFHQNEDLSRLTPNNLRGFGNSAAAVSISGGKGYGGAVSSSSSSSNGFGSLGSSTYNSDGAHYKTVIVATENNGKIGGNRAQAAHQQVGISTSPVQYRESFQIPKVLGFSAAAVSSNNGAGYKAASSASSLGGGFASTITSIHDTNGLNYDRVKGNTVQVIQNQHYPSANNKKGIVSTTSSSYSDRFNNGLEHKTASDGNLGNGIGSNVYSTSRDGIKYETVLLTSSNSDVIKANKSLHAKPDTSSHIIDKFGPVVISVQKEGLVHNPKRYSSSIAAVGAVNGVEFQAVSSTADSLSSSGVAGAYINNKGSTNDGAGYKVTVFNAVKPTSGIESAVSSNIIQNGSTAHRTVVVAENSGTRIKTIPKTAGYVQVAAYSTTGPGLHSKSQSSSINTKYY